jgi:hypothetical protein
LFAKRFLQCVEKFPGISRTGDDPGVKNRRIPVLVKLPKLENYFVCVVPNFEEVGIPALEGCSLLEIFRSQVTSTSALLYSTMCARVAASVNQ